MYKLRCRKYNEVGRHQGFFLICSSHDNLINHYKTNFQLMHLYHYSLTELENMMPWEREIYVTLLIQHIKAENEKAKQNSRGSHG